MDGRIRQNQRSVSELPIHNIMQETGMSIFTKWAGEEIYEKRRVTNDSRCE